VQTAPCLPKAGREGLRSKAFIKKECATLQKREPARSAGQSSLPEGCWTPTVLFFEDNCAIRFFKTRWVLKRSAPARSAGQSSLPEGCWTLRKNEERGLRKAHKTQVEKTKFIFKKPLFFYKTEFLKERSKKVKINVLIFYRF
jgi:hypothetical protein